jgi:VWFA-related protein
MRIRWIVTVVLLALTAGLATAQGPRRDVGENVPLTDDPGELNPDQPFTLSIDVNVVNVDVVVTNRNGDPISGLVREDFRLFVDDVEQPLTNFQPADSPLTVVILIEFGQTFSYFYDDVIGPSWGFIQSLRPDDYAAIVFYDSAPEILVDFTRNRNELLSGLQRLQIPTFRETAIFDALDFTLDRMDGIDGKKAIFLLSGGVDTISRMNYGEMLDRAEVTDTVIYSVGMAQLFRTMYANQLGALDRMTLMQAENTLRQISEASGGFAFFPRFQGEYFGIYDTVAAYVRYQYSLGFVPTGLEEDDELKEVTIQVDPMDVDNDGDLDELRVRHKRGFYMVPPEEDED